MKQLKKREIILRNKAAEYTVKFTKEPRINEKNSQVSGKRVSKRKINQEIPLNDEINEENTIGCVKDHLQIRCLKYSNILSKPIEIFMDTLVLKTKDALLKTFTPTPYKDLKSLDNIPGNPKYLVNFFINLLS